METGILTVIQTLIKEGIFTETSLELVIIAILLYLYKYILRPTKALVKETATSNEVQSLSNDLIQFEELNIEELQIKMNSIIAQLETLERHCILTDTQLEDFKRDAEYIKKLLNQFQGHLLYNHKSINNFGNRELK